MAIRKIIRNQIEDNAIVSSKLADNSIESVDMLDVYFDNPRILSVNHYDNDTASTPEGGNVAYINGYNFKSNALVYIGSNIISNITIISSSNIQIRTPNLSPGSYNLTVINPDGGVAIKIGGFLVSRYPIWISDGLLNPARGNTVANFKVSTDQSFSFLLANGSTLPSYLSFDSNTGVISGYILDDATANYNFEIIAIDPENQLVPRNFSLPVFNSRFKYEASFLLIGGGGAGGGLPNFKGAGGGGAGGITYGNLFVGGDSGIKSIDINVGYGGGTPDSTATIEDQLVLEVLAVGGGGAGGGGGTIHTGDTSPFGKWSGAGGGAVANTLIVSKDDVIVIGVGGGGIGQTGGLSGGGAGGSATGNGAPGGGGGGWSGLIVNNIAKVIAGGGAGGSGRSGTGSAPILPSPTQLIQSYAPLGGGGQYSNNTSILAGSAGNSVTGTNNGNGGWGGGGGGYWGGYGGNANISGPTGGGNLPSYGNSFIGSNGNFIGNFSQSLGGFSANITNNVLINFNYTNYSYGNGGSSGLNNGSSGIVIIRYLGAQRALGGAVTTSNGYTYHTFTNTGNSFLIANVNFDRNGGNTYFNVGANLYVAIGGGAGGDAANVGRPGGCGGGGGGGNQTAGTGRAAGLSTQASYNISGWTSLGFDGGSGSDAVGGGGGGSLQEGNAGGDIDGAGGNASSIFASWSTATNLGSSLRFAAGGGGGLSTTGTRLPGGIGGGGSGGFRSNSAIGIGSGGGGAGRPGTPTDAGGAGSPGAVFIRYPGRQIGIGGNIISYGGMTYHVFTSPGKFIA